MSLTDDKYDRQTRIWGAHGQKRLQQASILLLGCDPAGVETLKSLVLPGVGTIVIVDDKLVTEEDVENNFFTPLSRLGENRAQVVLELLLELNPDVTGQWFEAKHFNLQNYRFDLIICNEVTIDATTSNIIYLQTYGFVGKIRLFCPQLDIIESKPLGEKLNLRIQDPFPELEDFFQEFNFNGSVDEICHIPFIVILNKAIKMFRYKYNKYPETFSEKNVFLKQIILDLSKSVPDENNLNFYQAIENIQLITPVTEWKNSLKNVFKDINNVSINDCNDSFTLLCFSLLQFVNTFGCPPMQRKLPDMHCKSQDYLKLKNLYNWKANEDFKIFKQIYQSFGRFPIEDDYMKLFIENTNNEFKTIKYRTIQQEFQQPLQNEEYDNHNLDWYILLRAVEIYRNSFNRYPSLQDIQNLQLICNQLTEQFNYQKVGISYIEEMCRYEGLKLNLVASVIGGMASQEAIKIITQQFVPINNTLIYSGLDGYTSIYEF
ncbi:hypothetical protein pb186bvf_003987 [Paramecium bursaria]